MMSNKEFLLWLRDRLVNVYSESGLTDFVQRLAEIAENQIEDWPILKDSESGEIVAYYNPRFVSNATGVNVDLSGWKFTNKDKK